MARLEGSERCVCAGGREGRCGDVLSRRRVSVLRGWLAVPQMLCFAVAHNLSGCIAWDMGLY